MSSVTASRSLAQSVRSGSVEKIFPISVAFTFSPDVKSSSMSFSPGRNPVYSIWMSLPGSKPLRPDEVVGEVRDAHGLPHIEQIEPPGVRSASRLNDQ